MNEHRFELRGIRAGYEGIEVLHGIDLAVAPGGVCAVLGPNGAGKSTMLHVAAGLHEPTAGEVWFDGDQVTETRADTLARRGLCLIPEGRGVFPNLSVRENLRMATFAGVSMADVEARAYERFPRLADRRKQHAGTLSGGEQQMLAMARALSTSPRMLLLDELSAGLAPLVVNEIYELVAQIATDGVSILVVEQFPQVVLRVATYAAVMVRGRIVSEGMPDELPDLDTAYLGG